MYEFMSIVLDIYNKDGLYSVLKYLKSWIIYLYLFRTNIIIFFVRILVILICKFFMLPLEFDFSFTYIMEGGSNNSGGNGMGGSNGPPGGPQSPGPKWIKLFETRSQNKEYNSDLEDIKETAKCKTSIAYYRGEITTEQIGERYLKNVQKEFSSAWEDIQKDKGNESNKRKITANPEYRSLRYKVDSHVAGVKRNINKAYPK